MLREINQSLNQKGLHKNDNFGVVRGTIFVKLCDEMVGGILKVSGEIKNWESDFCN